MLFSTTSVNTGQFGSVATGLISGIAPFLYLIVGIAIAFLILDIILGIVHRKNEAIKDFNNNNASNHNS
jgi:predicted lipid-binding transport protein (Tim44 family)